jgi:CheY-like chemotaxis protein
MLSLVNTHLMKIIDKEYLTIVIADDDADDRNVLRSAFQDAHIAHKLIEVVNGLELVDLLENRGINIISEKEPDFVILDLNMPLVNGFEALKHIKSNLNLKNIPVYVLSTSGATSSREIAMDLGAAGYYKKADAYSEMVIIVSDVCNRHALNSN